MKNHIYLFILILFVQLAYGQSDSKWPALDASPMDVAYYPANVAWRNYLSPDQRNITPKIKLVYSRPLKKGRDIFGGLVPFGEEWRLGANEATTITFYQAVGIGDEVLEPATYTVFADVNEDKWTIHFSTEMGIWGNANRKLSQTVASIEVPTETVSKSREALAMTFQEIDPHITHLVIEWDQSRVRVPIVLNPVLFDDIDISIMDMAHYPAKSAYTNYLESDERLTKSLIQVSYGRPLKRGRNIFGDLIHFGEVWRMGANEATEIEFYSDVSIGNVNVPRGHYAMFAEVNADSWNIILSKDYPIWGSHDRNTDKDVATIKVPVSKTNDIVEALSIIFEDQEDGIINMVIAWDRTKVVVPIKLRD